MRINLNYKDKKKLNRCSGYTKKMKKNKRIKFSNVI